MHGPFRNDPAQGIPKHAYSPFDDINQPPPRQPAPGRDYLEGRLVIKFRPQVVISKGSLAIQGGAAAASIGKLTDSDSLNQTLQAQGIVSLKPVFPTTKPSVATASIPGVAAKPDLTRWYRAKCGTDVKTAVEQLSGQSGVEVAEPDYIRRPVGEMEQRTEDGGRKTEDRRRRAEG